MSDAPVSLDALAADILARQACRFTVAEDDAARAAAYRLRYVSVVAQGWLEGPALADGQESDAYDARAVHVLGWDGDTPVATGRLVLPPGALPTEDVCGLRVAPAGEVVDVGRMAVAPSHQTLGHPIFIALLARLYLEVRRRGFDVACGLMSPRARSLMRLLGLRLEVLGDERLYWGEPRAPVRFSVFVNQTPSRDRWAGGE